MTSRAHFCFPANSRDVRSGNPPHPIATPCGFIYNPCAPDGGGVCLLYFNIGMDKAGVAQYAEQLICNQPVKLISYPF
jgi:hypothetical protein